MKKSYNVDAQLIGGANGIFDVLVDGKKVFSKSQAGRFPNPGEVTKLISPK